MFPICKSTALRVPTTLPPIFVLIVWCLLGSLGWPPIAHAQAITTLPTAAAETTATLGTAASPLRAATDAADEADGGETEQVKIFQSDARALSEAFRYAAREATPAVVTVYSYGQNSEKTDANDVAPDNGETAQPEDETFGPTPPHETENEGYSLTGLGSGVIVDLTPGDRAAHPNDAHPATAETYWVMTNNHVIADAKRVVVQLPDESELVAKNVYGDPDSDIAVLQLSSDKELDHATLGDSDLIEIGDWVLAIGSPFKLEATVCAGIISAKYRSIGKIRRGRLFQTDAAINPGNSGGPLVNLDGQVVAISTAIATRNGGYQGIGFAIPINQAQWIARELAQHQRVRRAAIGVTLAELNPKFAKKVNLPKYLGVFVYQVIDGSAADVAGIRSMDVILEFAGQRVRRMSALQQAIEQQPVGSLQDIKIQRNGQELTKQIVLAPREDPTAIEADPSAEQ